MENSNVLLEKLPIYLKDKILIKEGVVYVEPHIRASADFQTWEFINRHKNIRLDVKEVPLADILQMKEEQPREVESPQAAEFNRQFIKEATRLINDAAAYRASDIHFKVSPSDTAVQFVLKGELRAYKHFTVSDGQQIIRAIYQGITTSRSATFNYLDFQNAHIPGKSLPNTNLTSVRIVRGPCYPVIDGGEFMTARLQYGNQSKSASSIQLSALPYPSTPVGELALAKMGYLDAQLAMMERLYSAPNGMVFFVGPTGAGKTTTLNEMLRHTARTRPESRLVTVEDPVEYPMPWATQLDVSDARTDSDTGDAFLDRVRVMLRMAPNSILIGEIRGVEVAVAAINAAITGHLVSTTMHVNDPFLFVDRLEIMDRQRLNRNVFCDPKIIRGVIAQRLLPHLCPDCSVSVTSDNLPVRILDALQTWRAALTPSSPMNLRLKGAGCSHCNQSGSIGRYAVAEIVTTDSTLMNDFIEHGTALARSNYRKRKDTDSSMLEKAIRMVLDGKVSPLDVEKYIDFIEIYQEGM